VLGASGVVWVGFSVVLAGCVIGVVRSLRKL